MPRKRLLVIALCLAVSLNAQKTKTAIQPAPNFQSQEFRAALAKVLHARLDGFSELKTGATVFQLPSMDCFSSPRDYSCRLFATSTGVESLFSILTGDVSSLLPGYSTSRDDISSNQLVINFCRFPKARCDAYIMVAGGGTPDRGEVSLTVAAREPGDRAEPAQILHTRVLGAMSRFKEEASASEASDEIPASLIATQQMIKRAEGNLLGCEKTMSCSEVFLELGRPREALEAVGREIESKKKLLQQLPDSAMAAENLAVSYDTSARIQAALGRLTPALRDLDSAIITLPKSASKVDWEAIFHYHRAFVFSEFGKFEDAAKGCRDSRDFDAEEDARNDDICKTIAALASIPPSGAASDIASTAGSPQANPIQSEIDAIARSNNYSPFPSATETRKAGQGANDSPERIVENGTPYTLHVLMSGPTDRRIDLAPGGSTSITIPPGAYKVAARVDSSHVMPFYGEQTLNSGVVYTSRFYISSH
jgi:hypothetical protein